MKKELRFPRLRMQATFEPKTLDADARTVEIRWYTGATVQRFSFEDGPYLLTMSMDPKAVRMGRLNSGSAPFKAGHASSNDLAAVLGVIERAWLDTDGGRAIVRFSKRAEVEPYFADVRDGILRNVSMEAAIHKADEVTKRGDTEPHLLATDWEPTSVALVAVGADPSAQALSETSETFPCQITFSATADAEAPKGAHAPKETRMKVRLLSSDEIIEIDEADFDDTIHTLELTPKKKAPEDTRSVKRAVDDAIERDKERGVEIKRLSAAYGMNDLWARKHINLGTSIDEVIELATAERAKRAPLDPNDIGNGDAESAGWRMDRMVEALSARAMHRDVPESARQYAHSTLVELAYECLAFSGRHRGLDVRANASRVVELALTTSDYPNLLANAANKILLPDYEAANPTYRMLAERQDLPDFKTASVLKAGDFPVPLQVAESGEIKLGSFSEAKDSFALLTYGRRLLFSFQAIVNDDLGAFSRIMQGAARRLADYENSLWFASLISASGAGPTLGDTGALFNATAVTTAGGHANLTASGTAISVDSLGVGRAAMKKQVSLDGIKLNIRPRYLLVSPDKETIADQYTTQITPALGSSVNPFSGRLETLSDANLVSANPWYLFADPGRAPVSVYGYLRGQAGPQVQTRQGFDVLGVEMRVALHFGFAFTDFRGAYRNAGA